jgi:hypothetical protein
MRSKISKNEYLFEFDGDYKSSWRAFLRRGKEKNKDEKLEKKLRNFLRENSPFRIYADQVNLQL